MKSLTVETRNLHATLRARGAVRSIDAVSFNSHNLGANRSWSHGYSTKPRLYLERMEQEVARGASEDTVFVLSDATDVVHNGCTSDEVLRRYRELVSVTGAKVVAAAELCLWPHPFPENRNEGYTLCSRRAVAQCCLQQASVRTRVHVRTMQTRASVTRWRTHRCARSCAVATR